jgi:uncharacterized protein
MKTRGTQQSRFRIPAAVCRGRQPERMRGSWRRTACSPSPATLRNRARAQGNQVSSKTPAFEDVIGAIDYMTTLTYVDLERIGAISVFTGAGYTANAAINGRRIKAMGTLSAVNTGSMSRNGWDPSVKDGGAIAALENGSKTRTAEAGGAALLTIPLAPLPKEEAPNKELEEAWEYYHTPRAVSYSPGFATARRLTEIIAYDSYTKAETFLRQPLQIARGSMAASKWKSDELYKRAASRKKSFDVVEGAGHMSLDRIPKYLVQAVSVLSSFFQPTL